MKRIPCACVIVSLSFSLFCAPVNAVTHFVDQSVMADGDGSTWTSAFKYLQSALDTATSGDEIRVTAGTYKPSLRPDPNRVYGNFNGISCACRTGTCVQDQTNCACLPTDATLVTFLIPSGVVVKGGYPAGGGDETTRSPAAHVTILSGDLNDDDADQNLPSGFLACLGVDSTQGGWSTCSQYNQVLRVTCDTQPEIIDLLDHLPYTNRTENARNVVTLWNVADTTMLDGFTITGGTAIYCGRGQTGLREYQDTTCSTSGGDPAHNTGGGVNNYKGSPVIHNCKFIGNVAGDKGAAIGSYSGAPNIRSCI